MTARSGAKVTLLSQWFKYALTLVGVLVISRLLGPSEVGLVSMTVIVVGLASLFGDFGLSLAAIQAERLSEKQRNTLFWLNSTVGVAATGIVVAVAPAVAVFYADGRVTTLLWLLASTLTLTGLGIQHKVSLIRESRFRTLALVDVLAAVFALALALALALGGSGYWALAWQSVALSGLTTIMTIAVTRWSPGLPRRPSGVRPFLGFGSKNLATQVANFVATNSPSAALGRLADTFSVGLFSRASQLTLLPIQQIVTPLTRVMLPRLARTLDPGEFNRILQDIQRVLSYTVLILLCLLATMAKPLVDLILGSEWLAMVPQIQVLAIATGFQSLSYISYWAFLARARTGWLFIAEMPGRLVMIIGVWFIAPLGPLAVAFLVLAQNALIWLTSAFILNRQLRISVMGLLHATLLPVTLTLAVAGASVAASLLISGTDSRIELIGQFAATLGVSVLLLIFFRPLRNDVRRVVSTLR